MATPFLRVPGVPETTRVAIHNYIHHRLPPGGFVRACLENDLVLAVQRADLDNRVALWSIVEYLLASVPSGAWGDRDSVARWLDGRDA